MKDKGHYGIKLYHRDMVQSSLQDLQR
jgi:hypothetical protein